MQEATSFFAKLSPEANILNEPELTIFKCLKLFICKFHNLFNHCQYGNNIHFSVHFKIYKIVHVVKKITLYVQILTITNGIKLVFHAHSLIQQNEGYLKRQQQMEDDQTTSPSSYPKKKNNERNIPAD